MDIVAIVERRPTHRYVHLPAFHTGGPVPDGGDLEAFAAGLVSATAGVPAADLRVSLHHAAVGQTLLPASPTDVEILHDDGVWRPAQHTAWLRHWHGSWGPLVSYAADGVTWTRAVDISRVRASQPDGSAVPAPRRRTREPQPAR